VTIGRPRRLDARAGGGGFSGRTFIEPKVMGRTLDIHPLIVLIVTALGGVIGGIVGLILAVPLYAIARNAIARLRSKGVVKQVADQAKPTVRRILK
jgi:predicted PurR-regulated permease PerM